MTPSLRERVARALYERQPYNSTSVPIAWGDLGKYDQDCFRADASAALALASQALREEVSDAASPSWNDALRAAADMMEAGKE